MSDYNYTYIRKTPEVKAQFFELLPDVMLELSKAWIKEYFHVFAEEHFNTYYIDLKKEREALYKIQQLNGRAQPCQGWGCEFKSRLLL